MLSFVPRSRDTPFNGEYSGFGNIWDIVFFLQMFRSFAMFIISDIVENYQTNVILRIMTRVLIDHTLIDLCEAFDIKNSIMRIVAYILGAALNVCLILLSDKGIACGILSDLISDCSNIGGNYFRITIAIVFVKKILETMGAVISEMQKETVADRCARKLDNSIKRADKATLEAEQARIEAKQARIEAKQDHNNLMTEVRSMKAMLEEKNGGGESLDAFTQRITNEQKKQIKAITSQSLTHALDQFDGITQRYDHWAIQQTFDQADNIN